MRISVEVLERAASGAAERVGHAILEDAIRNAPPTDVPNDPDPAVTLREAGSVDVRRVPGGVTVRIAFDTPYARKQHFEAYRHVHGGEGLFLEQALFAHVNDLPRAVAAEVRRAIGG